MAAQAAAEHDSVQPFEQMLDVEVADFRQRYQRYLFVLVSVVAWLAAVRHALMPGVKVYDLAPVAVLCLTVVLSYFLRQRTATSLALCLAGLALATSSEVLIHPGSPAVFLFAPLVILVSAVATTPLLFISGLGCGLLLAAMMWNGSIPPGALAAPEMTLFASLVCAWIASRPIFDSLSMAMNSAQESIHVRDELREQRRQLAQSVKALDETLYRLGRLNASLIIARQQAEEARQLKVHFANMISHEIRTPLNIIISFSEVIANAPESYGIMLWPDNLREDVNEIYRAGRHLLGLINDVLDLAQIEANRVVLKKEMASILEVVEQAVNLAGKWFDHAGLYLKTEVIGVIPEVQFDRIRIRQVILNLLSNARHYTATGGVTIRIECSGGEVVVSVKDTGLGIAAESLQHLFDEFQTGAETVDKSTGSGLGLSISRMFIGLHGGRMWAESPGVPGLGTTVSFSLLPPTTSMANELAPTQHDVDFWQSRYDQARHERVILVAADDNSVTQVAARMLNNQGHVLTCSLGGLSQTLADKQPDVVVTFSAGDGPDKPAALRLADIPRGVPVINCQLERNLDVENRPTLETQDINAWLLKPVTRDELTSAVLAVAPNVRSVLSVEDDLTMARFYELSLSSDRRVNVMPAFHNVTRSAEVLPLVEEHLPEVILLDLNLADGSGWDVLARLRARWSRDELPVIIVTAMDRYGLPVLRARDLHVYCAEGFSQRQTVMCLQNALDAVMS